MMAGDIKITQKMAEAINRYAGQEVITNEMVGRTFFVGNEGDGEVGIDQSSNYNCNGANLRTFIKFDGSVANGCFKSGCYRPVFDESSGMYWFEESPSASLMDDFCTGIKTTQKLLSQKKTMVIIGALYGFGELPKVADISKKMEDEASKLREAMDIKTQQ